MNDEIPGLRPIGAHLQALVDSSKKSDLSTHLSSTKTNIETAVERAQILIGCFRKDDAADPETYAGAVAAVLAEYSPDIVQRVTDPRSGLPSRSQWLPTVKEVRDACDDLDKRQREMLARAAREEQTIRDRRQWIASQERRPSLAELKAKYGENWGLSNNSKAQEEEHAERRKALQQKANQAAFAEECRAAGLPEDSPISPSLAALIRAGMA